MAIPFEGFIVHVFQQPTRLGARLCLVGRFKDGRTFAVIDDSFHPGFYIRVSDREKAKSAVDVESIEDTGLQTMDGEPCCRFSWGSLRKLQTATEILASKGIRTYEADLRYQDQFLMSRGIHGSVTVEGTFRPGKHIDRVFLNPTLKPSDWKPLLSVLSIDIETDLQSGEIQAIGMAYSDPWSLREEQTGAGETTHEEISSPPLNPVLAEEVLFVGELSTDVAFITCLPDERAMLERFRDRVAEWDPDIITGWNVIDFDLQVIARRFENYGIPLFLGRAEVVDTFLSRERGLASRMIIHGRQVLDAVRLMRAGPEQFAEYSLETVASSVLGYGKRMNQLSGKAKIETLAKMYRENPVEFCRYCEQDARLVIEILEKTGLIDLTVQRTRLIGIGLDRAWTSIAAFDFMYIESLHKRGFVAPTLGVDSLPLEGAPGGAIIDPQPGLYDNVLVYDFKSLYPSIILTFNIDPLSYIPPERRYQMDENELALMIKAPNGAYFRRDPVILPELLNRFYKNRDAAKERNDTVASYVYKIIMNSFYGVLGASGSRFAGSELSGAITSFGHFILHWCEDYLKREGFRVLYGDTDSLFVLSGRPLGTEPRALYELGRRVCQEINTELQRYIEENLKLSSKLELELEKVYCRFFLPQVRGSIQSRATREGEAAESPQTRGRAKGYAGMLLAEKSEGFPVSVEDLALEIVGMEAIRRDWTEMAKDFQVRMLHMVFQNRPLQTIREYIKEVIENLYAGRLDHKLVYIKALRKPTRDYKRSLPPHVKAASQLDVTEQRGLIRYLWTKDGPQPEERQSSPVDYDHYVEKQLKPIASMFTEALKTDIDHLINVDNQLWLF
jgi:DNA polymerase-2